MLRWELVTLIVRLNRKIAHQLLSQSWHWSVLGTKMGTPQTVYRNVYSLPLPNIEKCNTFEPSIRHAVGIGGL